MQEPRRVSLTNVCGREVWRKGKGVGFVCPVCRSVCLCVCVYVGIDIASGVVCRGTSIPYAPSIPFLAQRPSPFRHTVRTLGPFDRNMCRDTSTCAVHFVCTVHSLFAHRPSPFWHTVGTLGPFDVNMWIRAVERHCPSHRWDLRVF